MVFLLPSRSKHLPVSILPSPLHIESRPTRVTVSSGHVLGWCQFDGETHSMMLVDELTLCSAADGTLYVADICF